MRDVNRQIRHRVRHIFAAFSRGDVVHTVADRTFAGDGLITKHDLSLLEEADFLQLRERTFDYLEPQPYFQHLAWRLHIVTWAARQVVATTPGAFVEFGVHHGIFSRAICLALDFDRTGREFILVDSWGEMGGSHPSYREDTFDLARRRFAEWSSVRLVRGVVPTILGELNSIDSIGYLSLDMNNGACDFAALKWAWDRIPSGGIVYIDDWGWPYPELREKVGGFLRERGQGILSFASGNALVIKT